MKKNEFLGQKEAIVAVERAFARAPGDPQQTVMDVLDETEHKIRMYAELRGLTEQEVISLIHSHAGEGIALIHSLVEKANRVEKSE